MSLALNAMIERSPVGPLTLTCSKQGLRSLEFQPRERRRDGGFDGRRDGGRDEGRDVRLHADSPGGLGQGAGAVAGGALARALGLLERFLEGERVSFAGLPLDLSPVTAFQRSVLTALLSVEHGQLVTYGTLARTVGCRSARAVGQAVGANPLPVIIPCHRVVAGDGRLGGFSGGLERKVTLLQLEGFRVAPAASESGRESGLEEHLHGFASPVVRRG